MKSKLIQHYSQLLDNMAGDIEAFYVHPMPQWLCQPCTKNIDGNAANLQHLPLEITADSNHLQAKIGKWVLAQYLCDPLAEVLHRRLQPLLAFPLLLPAVQDWLTVIPSALRRILGFAQVGVCRSLFSAWNTKARYGARDERCQWCNLVHGDDLHHYLVCTRMLAILEKMAPQIYEIWVDLLHPPHKPWIAHAAFGIGTGNLTGPIVIIHDLLHSAYSSSKYDGVSNIAQCFVARCRALARHSSELQNLIHEHYSLTALTDNRD